MMQALKLTALDRALQLHGTGAPTESVLATAKAFKTYLEDDGEKEQEREEVVQAAKALVESYERNTNVSLEPLIARVKRLQ